MDLTLPSCDYSGTVPEGNVRMTLFEDNRMFYMVGCTPSLKTVRLSSRKYHSPFETELVFRYVVYMEVIVIYPNLKIETVVDESEISYLFDRMEMKNALLAGFREGDPLGKRFYADKFIKTCSIKFYKLVSTSFSGFICCSSFDVFDDKVKVFSSRTTVNP